MKYEDDDFGNRIKGYENVESQRRLPCKLPYVARLDGRAFSSFTRDFQRPYDDGFQDVMGHTMESLVSDFGASIGYTQSDEISLVWYHPQHGGLPDDDAQRNMCFGGRVLKITSSLAASATYFFNQNLILRFGPERGEELQARKPTFDARVWSVPNLTEATNCVLWRQQDCIKNSVSMLAQQHFSHKELLSMRTDARLARLLELGVDWHSETDRSKFGAHIVRRRQQVAFSAEELARLPPKHEAHTNPSLTFERSVLVHKHYNLAKISNRNGYLFLNEEPEFYVSRESVELA